MKVNPLVGFKLTDNTVVCLSCATKEEYDDIYLDNIMGNDVEEENVSCCRCGLPVPCSKEFNNE